MHYDLTISVPGDVEDARRFISTLVERDLMAPDRATLTQLEGCVRVRWERVHVANAVADSSPKLTQALAALAVIAADGESDAVPQIHLDVEQSRRLTQTDFDPAEDL